MHESQSPDKFKERLEEATIALYDSFLDDVRTTFMMPKLVLDQNKLQALQVLLLAPARILPGETDYTQDDLNCDYKQAIDNGMPVLRYLIPEIYSPTEQISLYSEAKKSLAAPPPKKSRKDPSFPLQTFPQSQRYSQKTLAIMLDDPNMGLDENDLQILALYRLTMNW